MQQLHLFKAKPGSRKPKRGGRRCLGCYSQLNPEEFPPERLAHDGRGPFCFACLQASKTIQPEPVDLVAKAKQHWTEI